MFEFKPICIRGRDITLEVLQFIRHTIDIHWDDGRSAISRILCEQWNWRQANGRLKDMACRDLLLRLERLGLIDLPPQQRKKVNHKRILPVPSEFEESQAQRLVGRVDAFQHLHLEMVRGSEKEPLWDSLVHRYHYLGCRTIVGGYLKYFAYLDGLLVACLGWGSAAWKVRCRDHFIGWSVLQRQQHLGGIANNVRFLILPWIQIQHLASKTLALCARILPIDWKQFFDDELVLLETFVDQSRFRGTCYRAANWCYLGQTKGSAKRGASYYRHGLAKAVFVYPLHQNFRQRLCR
ncbi:MAG: Druantia anti-phage system protein DruA [bacterium]